MAKVKITGHASGSGVVTVTAPNTSTDRTITLPDSTDTLIGSATTDALTTRVNGAGGRKNLIINGDFQVAQRGTSTTAEGFQTVDRFWPDTNGFDESVTQAQHALTSSDTGVWTKGFRNSYHITNGNQTSGAGAADRVTIKHRIEAQNVANSGWDYTSSSSYITFSFWVKSSVAQNFYGKLQSVDGTVQNYPFETGSLTANTWTQITKTVSGNSNITCNNDSDAGLLIEIDLFRGTDTTGSISLNTWAAFNSAIRVPDMTSTWYTTNDATFEITGVQLELGSVATDFEHRSYGEELALCQRYCWVYTQVGSQYGGLITYTNAYSTTSIQGGRSLPVTMRAAPTLSFVGNVQVSNGAAVWNSSASAVTGNGSSINQMLFWMAGFSGLTATQGHFGNMQTAGNTFTLNAEL